MRNQLRFEHQSGRRQSWASVDTDVREYVLSVARQTGQLLESYGFIGSYLHGSLAAGSFYRPKSDLDIIFVVRDALPLELRKKVALTLCDLSDARPIIGDIEISVLRQEKTLNFQHPLPFELHYGESHKQMIREGSADLNDTGGDADLAVYCTTIRAYGIALSGAPITEVFGEVPVQAYRSALIDDLEWILANDNIVESPFYGVLNCCRMLMLNTGDWQQMLSKEVGGEWALAHLPLEYIPVVSQAIACYRSCENVKTELRRTDGHDWDAEALLAFRDFVAEQTRDLMHQVI